jgi:K+-transporting ATPase ATPase C chain
LLIGQDGQPLGSALIGQSFDDPQYFWGRLSATSPYPYNAFNPDTLTASSGSNYGPLHPALLAAAQARIEALHTAAPGQTAQWFTAPVPVDWSLLRPVVLTPTSAPPPPSARLGGWPACAAWMRLPCANWWPNSPRAVNSVYLASLASMCYN